MGIMRHLSGLSKKEKEIIHKEYLEARNRLRKLQQPLQSKKCRTKSQNKNGKVVTYHINELEKGSES